MRGVDPLTVILSPNTKLCWNRFGAVSISKRLRDLFFSLKFYSREPRFYLFPSSSSLTLTKTKVLPQKWDICALTRWTGKGILCVVWVYLEKKAEGTPITHTDVSADLLSDQKKSCISIIKQIKLGLDQSSILVTSLSRLTLRCSHLAASRFEAQRLPWSKNASRELGNEQIFHWLDVVGCD